jgi:hypothetical protein
MRAQPSPPAHRLTKTELCGTANSPGTPGRFTEAVASSGSCPRAKSGGVRTENRASLAPSPWSYASSSTVRLLLKPTSQSVVRRPAEGYRLARTRHSTLAGGNRPPRRGAAGPDPGSGSPPVGRNPPAIVPLESPDTAADAAAAPKSSGRTTSSDTGKSVPTRCLLDRQSDRSAHGGISSPNNRANTPAEIP